MTARELIGLLRDNLLRALVIAAIVGTILVAINHGDHITREPVCDRFYLKCGLSYFVPFGVSMMSVVLSRTRARRSPPS